MTVCREGPVYRHYQQYMRCTNRECLYEWYADLGADYGGPALYSNDTDLCPECGADGEVYGEMEEVRGNGDWQR